MARSTKKGPFVDPTLQKKIDEAKSSNSRKSIKTWKRNSLVTPDFVGLTFNVHNGRKFVSVYVTENMVGHYLGEFVATRTFRPHSGQRKAGGPGTK